MTEKALEKLDILDKNERILEAIRAKKTNTQLKQRRKSLITPMLSDEHMDFGDTVIPSISKMVTETTEDKSHDLKKPKTYISFKYKPESRSDFEESDSRPPVLAANGNSEESKPMESEEEKLKSSPTSLRFLKDKPEAEDAKPLPFLRSYTRHLCKNSAEPLILSPKVTDESSASKKEEVSPPFTDENESRAKKFMYSTDHSEDSIKKGKSPPEVNAFITKESESTRIDQARTPLHFEDILKNSNIKTIDLGPPGTALYSTEQSLTNLINFHDTAYVQMWLLAKRFAPHVMTHTKKNVVLKKNYETYKALYDNPKAVSKPQRSKPVVQQKDLQAISSEQAQRSKKERQRKARDSLASSKRPPNTLYHLSRTFSSLTKKLAGYFDKDATQETSAKADRFERTFYKAKPKSTRKFTAFAIKYDSKPLKNILEIRKLNNITPLDNLLVW
ncbi:uncharacterized protein C1orf141 homolog [Acomys russatus]|uniref:uncharacterized protein C1orf141 homolog n=1 Tax=Acomys russatus TaxID=60746 RepID=UPI0021E1EA55|nr:uncharacterized protein C1orf141 homolog [Acomys russatus]